MCTGSSSAEEKPVIERGCVGFEAPVALPRWQNCEQFCEQHGYKVFGDVITTSKKVAWHFEMFFCAVCFQLEKKTLPLNFMGIWQAASDERRGEVLA